uniref:Latent transforming growth factor beta binding protein 2 n=1 Tax=Anas platyrhynchos TaxID=8839 RepID=A0A8B9T9X7_ANAPL
CEDPTVQCRGGECRNTPGSYECHCPAGFELLNDVNECLNSEICSPNGECLNSHGSYFCICAPGFSNTAGGVSCQDVDECADKSRCSQGQCLNTEGSYRCLCENWLQALPGDRLTEYEIHLDVCWQTVSDYICQDLLHGEQTTYTECCCRLGEAWGQNCALCPHRASGERGSTGKHPTVHSEGVSTRASRDCRLRSVASSTAARTGAACASQRATPATASTASSWT